MANCTNKLPSEECFKHELAAFAQAGSHQKRFSGKRLWWGKLVLDRSAFPACACSSLKCVSFLSLCLLLVLDPSEVHGLVLALLILTVASRSPGACSPTSESQIFDGPPEVADEC